jgi:hypothetical protein
VLVLLLLWIVQDKVSTAGPSTLIHIWPIKSTIFKDKKPVMSFSGRLGSADNDATFQEHCSNFLSLVLPTPEEGYSWQRAQCIIEGGTLGHLYQASLDTFICLCHKPLCWYFFLSSDLTSMDKSAVEFNFLKCLYLVTRTSCATSISTSPAFSVLESITFHV